jgi:Fe2+ or Zn2+ uptake regulation protein
MTTRGAQPRTQPIRQPEKPSHARTAPAPTIEAATSATAASARDELSIIEPLCAVFRRTLREQGLKYTAERARVLDAIVRFDRPFDGDELLQSLRASTAPTRGGMRVSKATTYRTLKLLQEVGALRRVLVKGEARYELAQGLGRGAATIEREGKEELVDAPELERAALELCDRLGLALVRWDMRVVVRREAPRPVP